MYIDYGILFYILGWITDPTVEAKYARSYYSGYDMYLNCDNIQPIDIINIMENDI